MFSNTGIKIAIVRLENEIKKIEGFIEHQKITDDDTAPSYIELLAELKAKIREYKIDLIFS